MENRKVTHSAQNVINTNNSPLVKHWRKVVFLSVIVFILASILVAIYDSCKYIIINILCLMEFIQYPIKMDRATLQ